ncbi:hypothetical protein ACTI_74080 [Actinoplanes sp. OR16]|uniref:TetR/AcrR family transcriptional regulator n=1 Tax=Actinoplanes sp. OR16 TaxID=946334 RepID=UPI000F6FA448|nr:hypothetical protein [Actinoplanes sp. OR16]BBH70723.1 hypothetical protein ACTI_74080 [Actinoplanes sp. OR16]
MSGPEPDQLHRDVVQAALPLLGELHTMSTAQIAAAAGVGEADLLAVFPDNQAVLQACFTALTEVIAAVTDPSAEMRTITAIRVDQPLASRLVEVIEVLAAYNRRIRTELDAFHRGIRPTETTADATRRREGLRSFVNSAELRGAVAALLETDEQHLRLPPPVLADAFVNMAFGGTRLLHPDGSPLSPEQIVGLFLHGARRVP